MVLQSTSGAHSQIDAGRGYIAVDEIRLSNRRTPAAPDPGDPKRARGRTVPPIDLAGVIRICEHADQDEVSDRLAAAVEEVRVRSSNRFPIRHSPWQSSTGQVKTNKSISEAATKTWVRSFPGDSSRFWAAVIPRPAREAAALNWGTEW